MHRPTNGNIITFMQRKTRTAPHIKRDRTSLEKAQAYLADGEYEACGHEIRKEAELVLQKYIYESELEDAIDGVKKLQEYLNAEEGH